VSRQPVKIAAIYKFVTLDDSGELRPRIEEFARDIGICGTLILAPEGINGTVAGTTDAIAGLVHWLETANIFRGRFRDAEIKYAEAAEMPFRRLKVRLKPEIVTLRAPGANPAERVGTYVDPAEWNDLIARDDITLIDTRNDYEVGLGSFEGALDPGTSNFTEFKDYVAENLDPARNGKVAMFCTGGIRCEKASSYLLAEGFEEVYHLKGGILNYLETVPAKISKWHGECFVFDERVSVTHGLQRGAARLCRACRQPLTPRDRAHPDFIEGVKCPNCAGPEHEATRRAAAARQHQMDLARQRGDDHLGDAAASAAAARHRAKKLKRERDRARNAGKRDAQKDL